MQVRKRKQFLSAVFLMALNSFCVSDALTQEQKPAEKKEETDPHLRSSNEVCGYRIESLDSRFGHIADFLFDDRSWEIRYIVIHLRNWLPSKSVLISPDKVDWIDWTHRRLHLRLSELEIKNSKRIA